MGRLLTCALAALVFAAIASAEGPLRSASDAFREGQFTEAATLAAARSSDADALAFAARATLAGAMCGDDQPAPEALETARRHADAALQIDPRHVEARLQLAIALSLRLRPMGTRDAMRTGDGGRARDLVEAVLADDPDNAYAHGFLSVWHLEVVHRGGRFGATFMGASVRDGLDHYYRAAALSPGDAALHWQVARALAALNVRRYREEIDAALAAAVSAPPQDRLQAIMATRAAQLQTALQTEAAQDVERLAREML